MIEIDRIVRRPEREEIIPLSDVHTRRLEEADAFPRRRKICPNSGKYGATGHMLSELQAWVRWRAAGGPGKWTEWWEAEQAAQRDVA
jgi:predicted DNA-binding transcriptional regulator AlpA